MSKNGTPYPEPAPEDEYDPYSDAPPGEYDAELGGYLDEPTVSEQALSEIVEQSILWQDAAQTLAYLICGVNGVGAEETLRIARRKLGRLFENMEHDAVCWKEIAERPEASDYIRAFAIGRNQSLRETIDKAHQRFVARAEGQ